MRHNVIGALDDIHQAIEQIDSNTLNPQQQVFVHHIHNTTQNLIDLLDGLPQTESAQLQVLPILGDNFLQPLVAVYGYAKLLLDSPISFNNATVEDHQRVHLQAIFDMGCDLQTYTESLTKQAFEHRLESRRQPIQPVNLVQLIHDNFDIYRYWIRDTAVGIQLTFDRESVVVSAKPYHLNALIQHIIVTIARGLVEYGTIRLSIRTFDNLVELHIFCTGLQIDSDVFKTLFHQDGRKVYWEQLQGMNGRLETATDKGRGATFIIRLPRAS